MGSVIPIQLLHTMHIYRIICLADGILELFLFQQVLAGQLIFTQNPATLPYTDHSRNIGNIGIFTSGKIFFIKVKLS